MVPPRKDLLSYASLASRGSIMTVSGIGVRLNRCHYSLTGRRMGFNDISMIAVACHHCRSTPGCKGTNIYIEIPASICDLVYVMDTRRHHKTEEGKRLHVRVGTNPLSEYKCPRDNWVFEIRKFPQNSFA